MSVLITGGISKFSLKLAEVLLGQGNLVVLLHNSANDEIPSSLLAHPSLKLSNLSSINEDVIRTLIDSEKVQKVFDCSLLTSDVNLPPIQGAKSLILGITSVLDAIRTATNPPSLTLVSGEEVYGRSTSRFETQPLEPVTFVGAAQMSVEAMVHSYGVSYRIPMVVGRLPRLLVESKEELASGLAGLENDSFHNFLSLLDVTNGIIAISTLADGQKPAEVFNVSNSFDVLAGNPAETRSSSLINEKILKTGTWSPSSLEQLEENLSGIGKVEMVRPVFLVYGDGEKRAEFVERAKLEGVVVKESSILNLQEASDKSVFDEINTIHPSHLIYFSNDADQFEGDCFTLRTNMATNLYFPWLLASVSERTAIHFTHFGSPLKVDAQDTSAEAVKSHTSKMLSYFENTLRLGNTVDKKAFELIRQKKTGALNNNV